MFNQVQYKDPLNADKKIMAEQKPFREIDNIKIPKESVKQLMQIYNDSKIQYQQQQQINQSDNINNDLMEQEEEQHQTQQIQQNYQHQLFQQNQKCQTSTQFQEKSKDLFAALDRAGQKLEEKRNKQQDQENQKQIFIEQQEIETIPKKNLSQSVANFEFQNLKEQEKIQYQNQQFTYYSLKDTEYDQQKAMESAFQFLKDDKKNKQTKIMQQKQDILLGKAIQEKQSTEKEQKEETEDKSNEEQVMEEEFDQMNFKPKFNPNVKKNKIQIEENDDDNNNKKLSTIKNKRGKNRGKQINSIYDNEQLDNDIEDEMEIGSLQNKFKKL